MRKIEYKERGLYMQTIVIANGVMNRGGAEVMIMDLLREIHKDFHFVFLINKKKGTTPIGDFDLEIKSMNIPIYYIDAVWDVGIKEFERQFRGIVAQIGPVDIVHSHLNSKGGIISRCAYRCGVNRRIVHCHAKLIFDGSFIKRTANNIELGLQRLWINKYATDYWACSSDALKSLFSKVNMRSATAHVIHNAIDLKKFTDYDGQTLRQEIGLNPEDILIGSIGRLANVKNYVFTADLIKNLWDTGFDVHYVVVGRKQDKETVDYLFSKLGDDHRFHYLGVRNDVEKIYKGIDIYLGTSKREGLGLSAVEAQASGTKCILSSGFPELCDMKLGLVDFVELDSINEWEGCIKKSLSKKEKITKDDIIRAVRESRFDIESEAQRVKELYSI